MTSRIDELQRLHEAAKKNSTLPWIWTDWNNDWPAIHRVLLAARRVDGAMSPMALEIELRALGHELRALDGDKGAT